MTTLPPLPARAPVDPADAHRPIFHFTAPRHWINDPNGVCFHAGRYHLFYQFNPHRAQWGDIHWGHASSTDLLHWTDEPIALAPDSAVDADGCFSGCFALVDGVPTLYYTGAANGGQTQCIAQSSDMRAWHKPQAVPVIAEPPPGVSPGEFRDPFVFSHGGYWYMLVGASFGSDVGACLLYRSRDGRAWTYRHPLFTSPDPRYGGMWECPNFFAIGARWVLGISIWPNLGAHWFTGRFEDERFVCEADGVLDVDGSAFAHLTTTDADGQPLQWAWLDEQRAPELTLEAGWAGAMSVPRRLGLDEQSRLLQSPARQIEQLRLREIATRGDGGAAKTPLPFDGRHLDIEATWVVRDHANLGIRLLASDDGREATTIVFDPRARRLTIDRSRSSLEPRTRRQNQWGFLHVKHGETLRLRVLLDASVLEVYANDRLCLGSRVYPSLPGSTGGAVFSDGTSPFTARVWAMRGIDYDNNNQETPAC